MWPVGSDSWCTVWQAAAGMFRHATVCHLPFSFGFPPPVRQLQLVQLVMRSVKDLSRAASKILGNQLHCQAWTAEFSSSWDIRDHSSVQDMPFSQCSGCAVETIPDCSLVHSQQYGFQFSNDHDACYKFIFNVLHCSQSF